MVREKIAVAACRERVAVSDVSVICRWMYRRTQDGGRIVCTGRDDELAHNRRKHDKPHGYEAKPCGQMFAVVKAHDSCAQ